jgi:hypothetical protein
MMQTPVNGLSLFGRVMSAVPPALCHVDLLATSIFNSTGPMYSKKQYTLEAV